MAVARVLCAEAAKLPIRVSACDTLDWIIATIAATRLHAALTSSVDSLQYVESVHERSTERAVIRSGVPAGPRGLGAYRARPAGSGSQRQDRLRAMGLALSRRSDVSRDQRRA